MNIDYYIENISSFKLLGKGFQSSCYDLGDFVLLESRYLNYNQISYKLSELEKLKKILTEIDVNTYRISDYKVCNDKIYILESKVMGEPLHDLTPDIDSSVFIERLMQLNNYSILYKFLLDYFVLCDKNIYVDAGSCKNFLFDGNSVGFIDLSLSDDYISKKYVCFYIIRNILQTYCNINDVSDVSLISFYVNSIYDKLCNICISLGCDMDLYTLSPDGFIEDFIHRKVLKFQKN
jgi:hypothetical protein